ncbi:hypothetical protein R3P38DRAFT_2546656 [Favolaschia claudopus]|uniref:H-type lectin domain-containing protein n=1 Tax=Favolaschia claudopus TaxID=2862362 RepID=A0AAW0AKK4_9AGAR
MINQHQIQSGVKVLVGPPGSFAWLRVQGPLTHEKLGGLTPVKGGVDAEGHPVYSARGFCGASDQRVVGGQVKLGSEGTVFNYNILVYKSPLYHFHNASGEYSTKNIWSAVKFGSINSSIISISPTAVEPPSIALAFTEIDMQHNSSDNHNVRAKAYVDSITTRDFRVHIDTWSSTILYNGGVSWLKIATGDPDFRSGVFKCTSETSAWIDFDWRFNYQPAVFVGISAFDIGAARVNSWQLKVYASDITPTGFCMNIDQPGGANQFAGCSVTWVAYAMNKPGVAGGTFGGNELTSSKYTGRTYFPRWFKNPPAVFLGISAFDIPKDNNIRLVVEKWVQGKEYMDWEIRTYAGSKLQAVRVNYLALDLNPYTAEELRGLR